MTIDDDEPARLMKNLELMEDATLRFLVCLCLFDDAADAYQRAVWRQQIKQRARELRSGGHK
jgi:hypothetical protein